MKNVLFSIKKIVKYFLKREKESFFLLLFLIKVMKLRIYMLEIKLEENLYNLENLFKNL